MNIYHGLLFQSGYITDPKLALRLGRAAEPQANTRQVSQPSLPGRPRRLATGLRWLLEELVLLGGRPMSTCHHDDLDEPFPTLHPCH